MSGEGERDTGDQVDEKRHAGRMVGEMGVEVLDAFLLGGPGDGNRLG